jgi:probable rRNA maturation factor
MDIYIENKYGDILLKNYEDIINCAIKATLEYENFNYIDLEVSVLIVNNEEIQQINSKFRKINKPTDVLSFQNLSRSEILDFTSGTLILGDIIISFDKVITQSAEYSHSQQRELAFLTAHSVLHLLGYDHMSIQDEERMIHKQKIILQDLGLQNIL